MLHATAAGYAKIKDYEIDLKHEGRPDRRLALNVQKLSYSGGGEGLLVLSVTDITEASLAEKLRADLVREKVILLQELHKRVANSLQIIASVLMQNARKVQSDETHIHLGKTTSPHAEK